MKIIRLTDDRYVLDAGEGVTPHRAEEISAWWKEWWATNTEMPSVMVIAGTPEPLEFEDRRTSDLEARVERLERLEGHFHLDMAAGPQFP